MKLYQKEEFKSTLPYQAWIKYFEQVNLDRIEKKTHNKVESEFREKTRSSKLTYEELYIRNFNYFYGDAYNKFLSWVFRMEKYFSEGLSVTAKDYAELNKYKAVEFPFWFPTSYAGGNRTKKRIERMVNRLGSNKATKSKLIKKRVEALDKVIKATVDPSTWKEEDYKRLKTLLCNNFSEHNFWGPYINELIKLGTLPHEAFEHLVNFVPESKTDRFDRIYAWALQIAYPNLNREVLKAIVGIEGYARNPEDKLWKVIFHKSFGLNHLIITAHDYTEAFGKACDIFMRMCLMNKGVLPDDVTIRVQHIKEKEAIKIIEYHLKKSVLKKTADWERVRSKFNQMTGSSPRSILNASLPKLRFLYASYIMKDELRNLHNNRISYVTSIVKYDRPSKFDRCYDLGIDFRLSPEYQDYRPDLQSIDNLIRGLKSFEENPGMKAAEDARILRSLRKGRADPEALKLDLSIVDSIPHVTVAHIESPKLDQDKFELKPVVERNVLNHDTPLYRARKLKNDPKAASRTSKATKSASNQAKPRKGQKKRQKTPPDIKLVRGS